MAKYKMHYDCSKAIRELGIPQTTPEIALEKAVRWFRDHHTPELLRHRGTYITLFFKTILFRPYVFVFLAAFLFAAIRLIGWPRTWRFWLISWSTAFVCEYSSTRNGIPFGWYHYNGSTIGQELYFSNIPFMDSISFSFLLYAAYCVALCLLLPIDRTATSSLPLRSLRFDLTARTNWRLWLLTAGLFAFIDMVIDPVALRGDRWFLGKIYYYPDPGWHFGVPFANYAGWAVVGLISLAIYFPLDRRLPALNSSPPSSRRPESYLESASTTESWPSTSR